MTSSIFDTVDRFRLRRVNSCSLRLLLSLIWFAFSGYVAMAQGGPPLLTDDTDTPGNRHWEINIATTLERNRDDQEQEIPLLDINYGLGERIQLKFEAPYLWLKEEGERRKTGPGNSTVGVRWRFFEDAKRRFALSTYPQLEFNNPTPSVRKGLVEQGAQFLLPVEITHKLYLFDVNEEVGYLMKKNRKDEWTYGLALGRQVLKRLELLGEIHGTVIRNFKEDELLFNFGGRLNVSKNLNLLFSSGRSFRRAASGEPTFILYAGTQFNF